MRNPTLAISRSAVTTTLKLLRWRYLHIFRSTGSVGSAGHCYRGTRGWVQRWNPVTKYAVESGIRISGSYPDGIRVLRIQQMSGFPAYSDKHQKLPSTDIRFRGGSECLSQFPIHGLRDKRRNDRFWDKYASGKWLYEYNIQLGVRGTLSLPHAAPRHVKRIEEQRPRDDPAVC